MLMSVGVLMSNSLMGDNNNISLCFNSGLLAFMNT